MSDIRAVELDVNDWKRLLEAADLDGSPQDVRIQDALRRAILNGASQRKI